MVKEGFGVYEYWATGNRCIANFLLLLLLFATEDEKDMGRKPLVVVSRVESEYTKINMEHVSHHIFLASHDKNITRHKKIMCDVTMALGLTVGPPLKWKTFLIFGIPITELILYSTMEATIITKTLQAVLFHATITAWSDVYNRKCLLVLLFLE